MLEGDRRYWVFLSALFGACAVPSMPDDGQTIAGSEPGPTPSILRPLEAARCGPVPEPDFPQTLAGEVVRLDALDDLKATFEARSSHPPQARSPSLPPNCLGPEEGSVTVIFDVDCEGRPANIQARDATHICLVPTALSTVESWRYRPRQTDEGVAWRSGVTSKLKFDYQ